MSYQVVRWVLGSSETTGVDRLVLLVLAEHADKHSWSCYPSIPTIAHEARISVSTARRSLRRLKDEGDIDIVPNGGDGYQGNRRPNLYVILAPIIEVSPDDTSEDFWGVISDDQGCQEDEFGVSLLTQEPSSFEPSFLEPRREEVEDVHERVEAMRDALLRGRERAV